MRAFHFDTIFVTNVIVNNTARKEVGVVAVVGSCRYQERIMSELLSLR